MSGFSIAIDGPAGAGKSSVSKQLALKAGFALLDTGAMYRAITVLCLQKNAVFEPTEVAKHLRSHDIEIHIEDRITRAFIDGQDVTEKLRSKEVTANVSFVAAIPDVRAWAVNVQRNVVSEELSNGRGIILEGRDIGSVVLPNADIKFFLTASDEVRAMRRAAEIGAAPETILSEIQQRDALDSQREISPLIQAHDAILIDASTMTIDEVVEFMLTKISSL
jgi:cytidylate kinase